MAAREDDADAELSNLAERLKQLTHRQAAAKSQQQATKSPKKKSHAELIASMKSNANSSNASTSSQPKGKLTHKEMLAKLSASKQQNARQPPESYYDKAVDIASKSNPALEDMEMLRAKQATQIHRDARGIGISPSLKYGSQHRPIRHADDKDINIEIVNGKNLFDVRKPYEFGQRVQETGISIPSLDTGSLELRTMARSQAVASKEKLHRQFTGKVLDTDYADASFYDPKEKFDRVFDDEGLRERNLREYWSENAAQNAIPTKKLVDRLMEEGLSQQPGKISKDFDEYFNSLEEERTQRGNHRLTAKYEAEDDPQIEIEDDQTDVQRTKGWQINSALPTKTKIDVPQNQPQPRIRASEREDISKLSLRNLPFK